MTVLRCFSFFFHLLSSRVRSTPCKKGEFEHLQFVSGHCLDFFFLPVSGKICHSPIKKVKRQPTLIFSFSQHSPFFEEQPNPNGVIRYLGSVPGSL